MSTLLVPARINLLGAWSDQADWTRPAAVLNAAVGWEEEPGYRWPYSPYPMARTPDGFQSEIQGIGTGLGVSSIRTAAEWLYQHPDSGHLEYLLPTLEAEEQEGTKGGWQDPIGAVEPGFKLIQSGYRIESRMEHPLMERVVLFDTGLRRPSRVLGEKVRALMKARTGHFEHTLSEIVSWCPAVWECRDTDWAVGMVLAAWRLISRYFPGMDVDVPEVPGSIGHTLCGAGGGGYGLMWCDEPAARAGVVEGLRERGLWATVPVILNGATWADAKSSLSDHFRPDHVPDRGGFLVHARRRL